MYGDMAGDLATNVDLETARQGLRKQIAHDLASPVRGLGILADLLAETLKSETVELDVVQELSDQLTRLSTDMNERLTAFANDDDS